MEKGQALLRLLKDIAALGRRRASAYGQSEQLLWFSDLPVGRGECRSPLLPGAPQEQADFWLEVRKTPQPTRRSLPECLQDWLRPEDLERVDREPQLLPEITVLTHEGRPDRQLLQDHPEIEEAWIGYFVEHWEPWATKMLRWQEVHRVYEAVDSMRRRLEEAEERFELVLCVGLVQWRDADGTSIRRHLLTGSAEIELDAARGVLSVVPSASFESFRVELDMLEFRDQPRLDDPTIQVSLDELETHAWDRGRVGDILRVIANKAQPSAEVDSNRDAPLPNADAVFRVGHVPALVLRERRPTAFDEVLSRLIAALLPTEPATAPFGTGPWNHFLSEGEAGERAVGQAGEVAGTASEDGPVLFPLPTNDQQRQIIDRLRSRPFVVVKGPPGTGKSLTIANLISHLLARGERVLVTAHAPKALDVLRGLLPEEIRALCVTSLGASREDQRLLEEGVRGILRRHNEWPGQEWAKSQLDALQKELLLSREKQAETWRRIRECREAELHPHTLASGYEGTAAQIAKAIEREQERYGWFPELPAHDLEFPLDSNECAEVAELHPSLTTELLNELSLDAGPELELPTPEHFSDMCRVIASAAAALHEAITEWKTGAPPTLTAHSDEALRTTLASLGSLDTAAIRSERVLGDGAIELISDLLVGRLTRWCEAESRLVTLSLEADSALHDLGAARIETPTDFDEVRLLADAQRRLAHFDAGGAAGFLVFMPRVVWQTRHIQAKCSVDGQPATSAAQLKQLVAFLQLRRIHRDLVALWPAAFSNFGDKPTVLPLQLRESKDSLTALLDVFRTAPDVLPSVPPANRSELADTTVREQWQSTIRAELRRRSLQAGEAAMTELHGKLAALTRTGKAHPCVSLLAVAVANRDPLGWLASWETRLRVLSAQNRLRAYRRSIGKLHAVAPRLAEVIVQHQGDTLWEKRLLELGSAWQWGTAAAWLRQTFDPSVHRALDHTSHRLESDIQRSIEGLAATGAWDAFFRRLDERTVQSLIAWTRALDRVGKGTGKYAYRHRRTAREYLMECIPVIPAWIMPLHKVWDTIDARPGLFDTVIIDEASQAGIQALVLLLLGKRVIVVGDDKQNSPEAVGVLEDDIARLVRTHLQAFRFKDEFRPDTSLFDHAERAFGNVVSLREHFRCVPEIIQFSNQLCYNEAPLIPLRQAPPHRLPPLKSTLVAKGFCEGDGQKIHNTPEADAVVEAVLACINDSEYDDKTLGVIVMQGQAQAELIGRRLAEVLDPKTIRERKLRCGVPATFQGDERDVIFLSLVMSPERHSRALTGLADQRRFNVAMSRARDQAWLFHSLQQHDLSPDCLRKRMLAYFQNSRREAFVELGEERARLEREAGRPHRAHGNQPHPYESWFEVDVALQLLNRGFRLRPQVEAAGKRIDLVIDGMDASLAVECDGDAWHGPEHYEQDMARERRLQRVGWTIVRVKEWEFYSNRNAAINTVLEACRELGIRPLHEASDAVRDDEVVQAEAVKNNERADVSVPVTALRVEVDQDGDGSEDVDEPSELPNGEATDSGPFSGYSAALGFPDPRIASGPALRAALRQVIERDGPLTRLSLYGLYVEACPDLQRAGKAVKVGLNRALGAMLRAGEITQEDEFEDSSPEGLVLRLADSPRVRERPAGRRDLLDIPPSELLVVLERMPNALGVGDDDEVVMRRLLDHFGFTRLTTVRRKHLKRLLSLFRKRPL